MQNPSSRLPLFGGTAVVAVAALVASQLLLPAAGSVDGLPVLEPFGIGLTPTVDGDDERERLEVRVDGAELVAAATLVSAASDDDPLTQSDRDLVGELESDTEAEIAAFARRVDAAIGAGEFDTSPTAVSAVLAIADPAIDEARHLFDDRYEVVGEGLTPDVLAGTPGVLSVELAPTMKLFDDPMLGDQWALENSGAMVRGRQGVAGVDVGWREASGIADGAGLVVAVIDSGIDFDNPDLAGQQWVNAGEVCGNGVDDDGNGFVDDCNGWDFVRNDGSVDDAGSDNRHGTHVAGTIAARSGNGLGIDSLASGARVMSVKVFDGGGAPTTRIAAGVAYAVDNGADVINMSLGGDGTSSGLYAALQRARDAGVLVVAAAGNDGRDIDAFPTYPAAYDLDNILSVGSIANDGSISSFSNRGRANVDLFAPGEQILATLGTGHGFMSGTSMAAPNAAAVALVTAASHRTTDAAYLKDQLLASVATDSRYAPVSVTGGRIDASRSVGDPVVPLGSLEGTFTGLAGLEPGPVDATATVGIGGAEEFAVDVDLALVRLVDGIPHAVLDHPVTVTLDGSTLDAVTAADGTVDLPPLSSAARAALTDGALQVGLTTDLPEGLFAFALTGVTGSGDAVAPLVVPFGVGQELPAPSPGDGTDGTPGTGDGIRPNPPSDGGGGGGIVTEPPTTGGGGGGIVTDPPTTGGGGGGIVTEPPTTGGGGGGGGIVVTDPPTTGGGGGGGGIVVTEPPTTGGGGGGIVTEPPSAGGGGATQPPSGAGGGGTTQPPATSGGERPDTAVDGVSPDAGPTTGGTRVAIGGEYVPGDVYYVLLGEQIYGVTAANSWELSVVTMSTWWPGPRDVEVWSIRGSVVRQYPGAYTFVEPTPGGAGGNDGGGVVTEPPSSGGGNRGGNGGGNVPPGNGGQPAPPGNGGDPLPPGNGGAPNPPANGRDDEPTPSPGGTTAGAPSELDDGMVVDRLIGGPLSGITASLWSEHGCDADPCPGVNLGT